ncbi:helix-turn-helix transcriptional regulator [Lentzea sp. HUAS12]|uniref:helix-turn-helix domain-containing protein n=1 Tax=Lentzea sp. HUAS12 TaxID=2951806 RepID=UPI00209DD379|nr:helix-turn-helix transcriptional regulator [Lentzea sp. HUAS12]USX56449.1 helix-turn-helix domain-containing protein [Lentzea sp. HUAS12]
MSQPDSPAWFRGELGDSLRKLREAQGKSRSLAAQRLSNCSVQKIGTIERGETRMKDEEFQALLDLYQPDAETRAHLEDLFRGGQQRKSRTPWGGMVAPVSKRYGDAERAAVKIRIYRPDIWPGLIQEEAYARAIFRTNRFLPPSEVELLLQARVARQSVLDREDPPQVTLILHENAVFTIAGDREIRASQARHALSLAERGVIELRLVEKETPLTMALLMPFTLFVEAGTAEVTVWDDSLTGTTRVDKPASVDHHVAAFDDALDKSLPSEKSLARLANLVTQL